MIINGQGMLDLRDGPIASRKRYSRRLPKLIANGDHTAAASMIPAAMSVPSTPTHGRNAGRVLAALALGATGLGLAAVGAAATINFAFESAGNLMAALAAGADSAALLTPTAACALWRVRRWLLGLTAWIVWAGASSITVGNIAGFVGEHSDSFFGKRETASLERGLILERISRLRSERTSIVETRPIGLIALAIRNATTAKIDDERAALAMARRRDVLDAELAALKPQLGNLPSVSVVDPSASVLAEILPSQIDLRRIRLCLLLGLPLCGGLLIAMGMAIATGTRTERSR
jgi:hypothetical protein